MLLTRADVSLAADNMARDLTATIGTFDPIFPPGSVERMSSSTPSSRAFTAKTFGCKCRVTSFESGRLLMSSGIPPKPMA